jgi:hypothetical protein
MAARLVREDGTVKIWELIGSGDEARVEAMLELYARLFPQYAHYIPRMRRRAALGEEHRPGHIVHYWLAEVNGQPAGIRTFRYVRERHCGIAIALAIDPVYREATVHRQRLSLFLIHACLDQIIEDAKRLGDPPPFGMVNEVEYPHLMDHYKHYGIIELPVKYIEPIFPPELDGRSRAEEIALLQFLPTSLGFLANPALNGITHSMENVAKFALAFLVDHYGLPMDHPQVQAALDSIPVLS